MEDFEELSPLALAFLGDAIHTAFVRSEVLKQQKDKLQNYHNQAKKFCNAKKQEEILEKITPNLTEEEKEIVRRARNSKPKHSAKNFDEKTYKKATSFEALIGWLYLSGQTNRMEEILKFSMEE